MLIESSKFNQIFLLFDNIKYKMVRLFLTVVIWNIIWNAIFFWIMTKLAKAVEVKEPVFVGEDENGNWIYKFQ